MSWKLVARAKREQVEAALAAQGRIDDWDADFVVGASEIPEAPQDWLLEAWLPRKPTRKDIKQLEKLFTGRAPTISTEQLEALDWVAVSQQHAPPVRVGPFRVRTPDFPPTDEPGVVEFEVPAAQAFGTGQHDTTAGCLAMLAQMHARGLRPRNIADIGTGTGLLAIAARALWPRARTTASDVDPVCAAAVLDNAARNGVPMGEGLGQLAFTVADGIDSDLLLFRAPYDLLIANILAAPLVELAPDFAATVAPRGSVLLAGLLREQEGMVRSAYLRAGFRPHARLLRGDWSILWLRRRFVA
jgi:ribosomal protein L11 methyltransferase